MIGNIFSFCECDCHNMLRFSAPLSSPVRGEHPWLFADKVGGNIIQRRDHQGFYWSVTLPTLEHQPVKIVMAREFTNLWIVTDSNDTSPVSPIKIDSFISYPGCTCTIMTTSWTVVGLWLRISTVTTSLLLWGTWEMVGMMRSAQRRRLILGNWDPGRLQVRILTIRGNLWN